jgi:hypothetical protein
LRGLLEASFGEIIDMYNRSWRCSRCAASDILGDENKYKCGILVIIVATGVLLWFFRILILFGFFRSLLGDGSWFTDFDFYYNATKAYMEGESMYINTGYLYPPLAILIFIPFSYLSIDQSFLLFSILNVVLLIFTTMIISRILAFYNILLSNTQMILLTLAIFLTYPVSITFTHGQINILIFFLITSFYYSLFINKNVNFASLLLSIATVVKIWPSVLILLNFLTKNAKNLLSRSLLIIGILCVISLILFGIFTHIDFLDKLADFQSINMRTSYEVMHPPDALDCNASIFNFLAKMLSIVGFSDYYCPKILFGIKILLVSCLLYFFYRSGEGLPDQERNILMFSSLIILVLVASNRTWSHYATFLVLPYILLIFVLELDRLERLMLIVSIILFSVQEYVIFLSNIIGGFVRLAVYIASPTMLAYTLFLVLIIYMIIRRKNNRRVMTLRLVEAENRPTK